MISLEEETPENPVVGVEFEVCDPFTDIREGLLRR